MKRGGFTMIELIFVIVILGILAAVAIPKLAATRDDAKVSKALSEVSTAISDMGAYYTAHGQFASPSSMTNVSLDGNITNGAGTLKYQTPDNTGSDEDCVKFTLTSDGNITVADDTGTGNVCSGLQSASSYANDLKGSKQFGGSKVSY